MGGWTEASRAARPAPILAHRPCATSATCARNSHRAVGVVDKRAILFSRQIRECQLDDGRRDRLDAGEAVVDCLAELQARADTGEIRNRLESPGRPPIRRSRPLPPAPRKTQGATA